MAGSVTLVEPAAQVGTSTLTPHVAQLLLDDCVRAPGAVL
jgi:hypothetical protein